VHVGGVEGPFELFDNLIRVFLWTGNHSNRHGHKQNSGEQQVSHRGLLSQLQNEPIDFDAIASGDGSRPLTVSRERRLSGKQTSLSGRSLTCGVEWRNVDNAEG